jgi:hypothetical protein
MHDALTFPALPGRIIPDLAMMIDALSLGSGRSSTNCTVKHLHNLTARARRQLRWNANFKETIVAITPLDNVVDHDLSTIDVHEALALPALSAAVIGELTVTVD